jgi:predicted NACHT family NTPase
VREHSGLLLDRGGRQYGFIHLTFQEYLAGVALAQLGQQGMDPVVKELSAHLGDDNWHEVSLLCIGFISIIQQRDEAAGAVLEALLEQAPDHPGEAQ